MGFTNACIETYQLPRHRQPKLDSGSGVWEDGYSLCIPLTSLIVKFTFLWETIYWSQSGTKVARMGGAGG